jgi:hypothetical protein
MRQEDSQEFGRILATGNLDKRNCKELRKILNKYQTREYQCFCDASERIPFWEEMTQWYEVNKWQLND